MMACCRLWQTIVRSSDEELKHFEDVDLIILCTSSVQRQLYTKVVPILALYQAYSTYRYQVLYSKATTSEELASVFRHRMRRRDANII